MSGIEFEPAGSRSQALLMAAYWLVNLLCLIGGVMVLLSAYSAIEGVRFAFGVWALLVIAMIATPVLGTLDIIAMSSLSDIVHVNRRSMSYLWLTHGSGLLIVYAGHIALWGGVAMLLIGATGKNFYLGVADGGFSFWVSVAVLLTGVYSCFYRMLMGVELRAIWRQMGVSSNVDGGFIIATPSKAKVCFGPTSNVVEYVMLVAYMIWIGVNCNSWSAVEVFVATMAVVAWASREALSMPLHSLSRNINELAAKYGQ